MHRQENTATQTHSIEPKQHIYNQNKAQSEMIKPDFSLINPIKWDGCKFRKNYFVNK